MSDFILVAENETALRNALERAGYLDSDGNYIASSGSHSLNVLGVVVHPATFDEAGEELTPAKPYAGFAAMIRLLSGVLPDALTGLVVDPSIYGTDVPVWGGGDAPEPPALPRFALGVSFSTAQELMAIWDRIEQAEIDRLETEGTISSLVDGTFIARVTGGEYTGDISLRRVYSFGNVIVGEKVGWERIMMKPATLRKVVGLVLQDEVAAQKLLVKQNGGTFPRIL